MPIKNTFLADGEQEPSSPGSGEIIADGEDAPKKRKRRTRAELIADARIPDDAELVEVVFEATGVTGERPWETAVKLAQQGKIEFVDKSMKYSLLKHLQMTGDGDPPVSSDDDDEGEKLEVLVVKWNDLQKQLDDVSDDDLDEIRRLSAKAQDVRERIIAVGGEDPDGDEPSGASNSGKDVGKKSSVSVPPDAMVGDEVVRDDEVYYVGHGHMLIQHPPSKDGEFIDPAQRWSLVGDEWAAASIEKKTAKTAKPAKKSDAKPEAIEATGPQLVEQSTQQVNIGLWKVSMGYLEKIGLPEYSSLQIGPCSAQRHVLDDGRRTTVAMHGREVEIPTSVVEAMQEAGQVCEYVMRAERQAMVNFLESVKPGSTKPS